MSGISAAIGKIAGNAFCQLPISGSGGGAGIGSGRKKEMLSARCLKFQMEPIGKRGDFSDDNRDDSLRTLLEKIHKGAVPTVACTTYQDIDAARREKTGQRGQYTGDERQKGGTVCQKRKRAGRTPWQVKKPPLYVNEKPISEHTSILYKYYLKVKREILSILCWMLVMI